MEFRQSTAADSAAIESLFISVFSKSEGEAEGALIGDLTREMMATTDEDDLHGFVAVDKGRIIGSIFFSRLWFEDEIEAFILSPVAVDADYQGQGCGQALISFGLHALREIGVTLVLTYGDPGFYCKVGFRRIAPENIRPPFELSHPQGWLGQSLHGDAIEARTGTFTCVKALSKPIYW